MRDTPFESTLYCRVCKNVTDSGRNICKACNLRERSKKHNPRVSEKRVLTKEEVAEIKKLRRQFWTINKIATKFGITRHGVSKALNMEE